ncbi:MAG: hypothetical protein KF833_06825 [Verrucomicrobiae bacterium]|nr:hypothetical protein [Verrucomicrobiae bacterium]
MNATQTVDIKGARAVTVLSKGIFIFSWKVETRLPNGNVVATPSRDWVKIGDKDTIDLAKYPELFTEGAIIWPRVHAELGEKHSSDAKVPYSKDGLVALYLVSGTTQDISISFEGFLIPPVKGP